MAGTKKNLAKPKDDKGSQVKSGMVRMLTVAPVINYPANNDVVSNPVTVTGTAGANETVTIYYPGGSLIVTADGNGNWSGTISPQQGAGQSITAISAGQADTVTNITVQAPVRAPLTSSGSVPIPMLGLSQSYDSGTNTLTVSGWAAGHVDFDSHVTVSVRNVPSSTATDTAIAPSRARAEYVTFDAAVSVTLAPSTTYVICAIYHSAFCDPFIQYLQFTTDAFVRPKK